MTNPLPSVSSPPWSNATKRIAALITLVALFLIAGKVDSAAWTAIVVSVLLAYLLSPVVTFFEQRLKVIQSYEIRRSLAVVLTWLVVLGLVGLGIGLVIPAMVAQLREFSEQVPDLIKNTESDLRSVLDRPITIGNSTFVPWQEIENAFNRTQEQDTESPTVANTLQNAVLSLADPALGVVGGIVSAVVNLFFVLIMLFYLMRDGPLFVQYIVDAVPESYQGDARRLLHELALVWNGYLRGQLLLCTVVGVATYIAALILGLPQPLLLAMVAGFFEFIPNIGPTISQIPALLFALTTDSSTFPGLDAGLLFAVIVSLTYIMIQNLEAVFLVPRILGGSLDLHPFVVLVSVLVGAGIAGVLGIVLAAPTVATIRVFLRYLRGKLLDEEAFPDSSSASSQQRGFFYMLLRYFMDTRFPILPDDHQENVTVSSDPGEELPQQVDQSTFSGWMNG